MALIEIALYMGKSFFEIFGKPLTFCFMMFATYCYAFKGGFNDGADRSEDIMDKALSIKRGDDDE